MEQRASYLSFTNSPDISIGGFKNKVFIVGGDYLVSHIFAKEGWEESDTLKECDLVVFTGGSDIGPELYGCKNTGKSYTNPRRDFEEVRAFTQAEEIGKPMAGICRGGQLLNVMMGGAMYQDVSLHTRDHTMTDLVTGKEIYTSSVHHQMMIPGPTANVRCVSSLGGRKDTSGLSEYQLSLCRDDDPEVILYTTGKGAPIICVQGHPEYNSPELCEYFFYLINEAGV